MKEKYLTYDNINKDNKKKYLKKTKKIYRNDNKKTTF